MSSNIQFIQNNNNFLHGVRGVVWIDGSVAGAVQDIEATESGEPDPVYVMGSRYIQAKEIKNKRVDGTIKSLLFDPTQQKLLKLTDPTIAEKLSTVNFERTSNDGNVLQYTQTQLGFERTASADVVGSLMPMFDMEVEAQVIDSSGAVSWKGFVIKGCIIVSYDVMFNKDTWWIGNITYLADKIIRKGTNNPVA